MALYIAVADERGAPRGVLQGTTQNDIIKEYLSRGSYVFPPDASLRLTKDLILCCAREAPKFNPMNVCSYHLQEAGATPVQELAYALATAIAVLDPVRAARSPEARFRRCGRRASRSSSTPACGSSPTLQDARVRRALGRDRPRPLRRRRPRKRRFRYGVQVNSLGLTESSRRTTPTASSSRCCRWC